jgi:SAM-dependent methyltransferase
MEYLNINKESWNRRAEVHYDSEFYNVAGFLNGDCSLKNIEIAEMGDVREKTLLHLQCHFGMDTLSWARKGAIVTGIDISDAAIKKANELKEKTNLKATFICSDIYEYRRSANQLFDIVFTSYGAICWLPDLEKWGQVVSNNLKSGGTFYMVEFHPIYDIISGFSYFHRTDPDVEIEGTYTENSRDLKTKLITWTHPLSEVINSLIKVGIQIDFLNEYPYSPYNCYDGLEEREKDKFYLTRSGQDVPLVYSIKGTKST